MVGRASQRATARRWGAAVGLTGLVFLTACNGSGSVTGSGTVDRSAGTAGGTVTLSGPDVPGGSATYSGTVSFGGVSPAATPELGSLALFGTGAAGMAGYVLARARAGRRR